MTPDVRRIAADDWRLLRDVRLRALTDAPDAFGSTADQARGLDESQWRQRADNGAATLLAVQDGVGLAMGGVFAPEDRPTLVVWGMWTDPAARGRGLGARLLDDLLAWCHSPHTGASYDEVRLHVTEGNAAARRLYVGRGFEPTGTWEPLRETSPLRVEELRLAL